MSTMFKDVPQGGGGWFKAADHLNAHALMIEVKGFDRQRPTPNGPKDSALCDVTVFADEAALDAGSPDLVQTGTRIEQTAMARDLSGLVGSATIVTIGQSKPKAGQRPAWIFNTPSVAVKKKVMAYYEKREAAVADAIADAPDFGD